MENDSTNIGFWHEDRGYWETLCEPPQNILDGYPEGTKRVDLKPGDEYEFDGTSWVQVVSDPAL